MSLCIIIDQDPAREALGRNIAHYYGVDVVDFAHYEDALLLLADYGLEEMGLKRIPKLIISSWPFTGDWEQFVEKVTQITNTKPAFITVTEEGADKAERSDITASLSKPFDQLMLIDAMSKAGMEVIG